MFLLLQRFRTPNSLQPVSPYCPTSVAAQVITIWLVSFVYLKRVLDVVGCSLGTDDPATDIFHKHLHGILYDVFPTYPCSRDDASWTAPVAGLLHVARRPNLVLYGYVRMLFSSVEELGTSVVVLLNAVVGMAVLFRSARRHIGLLRLVMEGPFYLHNILPLVALLLPGCQGLPSLLQHQLSHRGMYILYLSFTGAQCLKVLTAAVVGLSCTVASLVLLNWRGAPTRHQPLQVVLQYTSLSVLAVFWAALRDGVLLRRLDPSDPVTSYPFNQQHVGLDQSTCEPLKGMPDNAAGCSGDISCGATKPRRSDVQMRAAASCSSEALAGMPRNHHTDKAAQYLPTLNLQQLAVIAELQALVARHTAHRTRGHLHAAGIGGVMFAGADTVCARQTARGAHIRAGEQVVGAASSTLSLRPRFRSMHRRHTVRIRITGANPEHLPADWQDFVVAQFDGCFRDGLVVSGTSMRRGSIYVTVSLSRRPVDADQGGEAEVPEGVERAAAAAAAGLMAAAAGAIAAREAREGGALEREEEQVILAIEELPDGRQPDAGLLASGLDSGVWPGAGRPDPGQGPNSDAPAPRHMSSSGVSAPVSSSSANAAVPKPSSSNSGEGRSRTTAQSAAGVSWGPRDAPSHAVGSATGHPGPTTRRRVTGVWRADRLGDRYMSYRNSSRSPGATTGTSNAPLSTVSSADPQPGVAAGASSASGASLRYQPLLSAAQHVSLCNTLYGTPTHPSPVDEEHTEPWTDGPVSSTSGGGPGALLGSCSRTVSSHASARGHTLEFSAGPPDASSLLDSLPEAAAGPPSSRLWAVSQVDRSAPQRIVRRVLETGSACDDAAASSSWENSSLYQRPAAPTPAEPVWHPVVGVMEGLSPLARATVGATGSGTAAGSTLLMPPHTARVTGAMGFRQGPDGMQSLGLGGSYGLPAGRMHAAQPANGQAGSVAAAGGVIAWSEPHGALPVDGRNLPLLADAAAGHVGSVAVEPVLICKAPLPHTGAGAGSSSLVASIAPSAVSAPDSAAPSRASLCELRLSLKCLPSMVSQLSVMLRYCSPTSVFGEQMYLPVQLQLDSSSPAVAAAIRLQATAASNRSRSGDTQPSRDVVGVGSAPLLARATVRAALADLACPGVLYVELWHGPQLSACLPVLLLPADAAGWALEVCSLWERQAEEEEAAAALAGDGDTGTARGAGPSTLLRAAAHQVVEDLGGWLTYAAHKQFKAEAAAAASAAVGAASMARDVSVSGPSADTRGLPVAASTESTDSSWSYTPHDPGLPGPSPGVIPEAHELQPPSAPMPDVLQLGRAAAGFTSYGGYNSITYEPAGGGGAADSGGSRASGGRQYDRALFHDMMLQEGYNWLADCVEEGCCGLAAALMDALLAVGCSAAEVLRTCRSADGLPLMHAATLSNSPSMVDLVWRWAQAAGTELSWEAQAGAGLAWAAFVGPFGTGGGAAMEEGGGGGGWASAAAPAAMPAASVAASCTPLHLAAAQPDGAMARHILATYPAAAASWGATSGDGVSGTAREAQAAAAGGLLGLTPAQVAEQVAADAAERNRRRAAREWLHGALLRAWQRAVSLWQRPELRSWMSVHTRRLAEMRVAVLTRLGPRLTAAPTAVGASLLRAGDAAVMAIHGSLLHMNLLHRRGSGGMDEQEFLSFFQQRHGWVFSTWCWSMTPIFCLILWRHAVEREWARMAWAPLWTWLYLLCAGADLAGATARYRPRTEALAAVMHLTHTACKALACVGVPAYPVPRQPRRLYWMDVLACATLSALCEPVRICVALPVRVINFAVSTQLYRISGAASSALEAMLLSASCHGMGLLLQHAVESYYRSHFALHRARTAAAAPTGAAAGGGDSVAKGASNIAPGVCLPPLAAGLCVDSTIYRPASGPALYGWIEGPDSPMPMPHVAGLTGPPTFSDPAGPSTSGTACSSLGASGGSVASVRASSGGTLPSPPMRLLATAHMRFGAGGDGWLVGEQVRGYDLPARDRSPAGEVDSWEHWDDANSGDESWS